MSQTARFEFRVDPDTKADIEKAAAMSGETASVFARRAAIERAQAILRQQRVTVVPPEYFDALMAELDEPTDVNDRVQAAVRRLHEVVKKG